MHNDDTSRMRFIKTLDVLSEGARAHLLAPESETELAALFQAALANGFSDVAASVEVESDSRK